MTPDETVAAVMDDAAARTFAGVERAYDIGMSAMGALVPVLTSAACSGGAYGAWGYITDLADAPRGPQSLEYCAEVSREFAGRWMAMEDRANPGSQAAFFDAWWPRWEEIAEASFR